MMHKLAVVGNPIEHSLSPRVFNSFARQFNINLEYGKILAHDAEDFNNKVRAFFDEGGLALNVTSPFKNEAYEVGDKVTSRSSFCKASNFIRFIDNQIISDTTDGIGLVDDIKLNRNFSILNKKILIIGSGFVLDSILLDIIAENPLQIDVLARNEERINYLTDKFGIGRFDSTIEYGIIINSTPNVPDNNLFDLVKKIKPQSLCYDLSYTKPNYFLPKIEQLQSDVKYYNGLGMLVIQAAIAFNKLFDHQPNIAITFDELSKDGYTCS